MQSRKIVLRETAIVLLEQILCVAAILGIFKLLGYLDQAVLLGGIVGGVLAVLNFFFMAVGVSIAADKAQAQNVKGGKATLQLSMFLRYAVMFVVLIAFAKSGLCNALAMVLPIVLVRPMIAIDEFFRKAGEQSS